MPDPLSLTLGAFSGDFQSQSPWSLSSVYSSSGSVNLYINKLGQIKVIDGFSIQNDGGIPFTMAGSGSVAMIRGLYQFNRITSGSPTDPGYPGAIGYQILYVLDDQVNEWELHVSSDLGITDGFIADMGAGSVGAIPDFATFGDQLFITNGVIVPQMYNGTSIAATGATQLAAPTLADGGAGVLNGAGYVYRVVPITAIGGVKGRKPGSVASSALDVQNRAIDVSWTADSDGNVIGYEVFRTTGSGIDLYLVTYSDGRTVVTYHDNLSDAVLLTRTALGLVASHGDPPPTGAYFCVSHRGRMWWLATDTYPRRAWWSDPGDPDSVYQDRSYTECTDADALGDRLVGGTGEYNGVLVLWLQNSIWTVSGTGQIINNIIDWRKKRSNAVTGAVHHRATVRVPQGAVYLDQDGNRQTITTSVLAFLTPLKDIRLFDGDSDTIISFPKTDTLARMYRTVQRKSFAYVDKVHGMIVWVFPIDSSEEPNYSVAWNYWFGTWHEWSGTTFGHAIVDASPSTTVGLILAGEARVASGAFIYRLWEGLTSQAGASITATLMTKPIYPPIAQYYGTNGPADLSHEKRLENLFLLFEKDASPTSLTLGILPHDAADGDTPTISRTLNGSSRVNVPARIPAGGTNPGKYFYGAGWRLKLTSTGTTGPWTLRAIEQVYSPLLGQTR